jgi:hypothetical protein
MHDEIFLAPENDHIGNDLSPIRQNKGVTSLPCLEGFHIVGEETLQEAGGVGALDSPDSPVRTIGEAYSLAHSKMLGNRVAVMERDRGIADGFHRCSEARVFRL